MLKRKRQWNLVDALDWRYKEGYEEGRALAVIARNALKNGLSIDQIHEITGIDADAIKKLRTSAN